MLPRSRQWSCISQAVDESSWVHCCTPRHIYDISGCPFIMCHLLSFLKFVVNCRRSPCHLLRSFRVPAHAKKKSLMNRWYSKSNDIPQNVVSFKRAKKILPLLQKESAGPYSDTTVKDGIILPKVILSRNI